jgi:hypothetical protein
MHLEADERVFKHKRVARKAGAAVEGHVILLRGVWVYERR